MLIRRLIVASVALLLGACAMPMEGTDTPDAIGGTYFLNGVDFSGTEYGGQLIITQSSRPEEYELQWIVTGSLQTGAGTFDGATLVGSWETVSGAGDARGTAEYQLQDDGRLLGERLVDGQDTPNTEEAFPVQNVDNP